VLVNGDVFQCVEYNVEITSPTIKEVATTSTINKAIIECMAACQSTSICRYWSLNKENWTCQLKEKNQNASSETYVSGVSVCSWCTHRKWDLSCSESFCSVVKTIEDVYCKYEFSLEVAGGKFDLATDRITVGINGGVNGICRGANYVGGPGDDPPWTTCGVWEFPPGESYTLRLSASSTMNGPTSWYNGINYTLYGRVTNYVYDDLFEGAARCPNASEIAGLEDCTDARCGEYCYATSTLPDHNSNYNINNCLNNGNRSNIFIHICNSYGTRTLLPTRNPIPISNPTLNPTIYNGKGNEISLKISKGSLFALVISSNLLLSFCCVYWNKVKPARLKLLQQDVLSLHSEDRMEAEYRVLPSYDWSSSHDPGERYRTMNFTYKQYFISDLEVGKLVGRGSFSKVYLVTPKESSILRFEWAEVAGKIINPSVKTKSFFQEVNILNSVSGQCDYIVNVIGIVMKPKIILMEYYRKGSLDLALAHDYGQHAGNDGSKFPILLRLKFMLQLCYAVKQLHKNCIVHRDLASRNLLLSDDNERVVLTDFGLARKIDVTPTAENWTQTTAIPRASPPESWTIGKIQFSLKSDVWGAAMTMYEILNMRPMPKMLNELKCLEGTQALKPKKILLDDIIIGKSFTRLEELWYLMSKCWYKIPERRPQIWEVERVLKDLSLSPLARKENAVNYVDFGKNYFDRGSEYLNERWHSSENLSDSLRTMRESLPSDNKDI